MHHYKYIVVKKEDIHKIIFEDIVENDIDNARWNKDRSLVLLKFLHKCPCWHVRRPIYQKSQIIQIIQNGKW